MAGAGEERSQETLPQVLAQSRYLVIQEEREVEGLHQLLASAVPTEVYGEAVLHQLALHHLAPPDYDPLPPPRPHHAVQLLLLPSHLQLEGGQDLDAVLIRKTMGPVVGSG